MAAFGSRRFAVGLVVGAALASASCDRTGPSEPPGEAGLAGVVARAVEGSDEPSVPAEPETEGGEAAEVGSEADAEAACTPPPAPEPVETWSASGPPAEPAAEPVCTALEERARRAIARLSGPCETADDCELVRVACPFGCVGVFSKSADRRRARMAFDRYTDECPICKDKCPPLPPALACEDGVCVAATEAPESDCADALSGP